jgi:nicotinate-nucleotide adenylyltransferase
MLVAAVDGDPLFEVSTVELDRAGPSFTVETLEILETSYPGRPLFLILGADQWGGFARWRRPRDIAARATIVLMSRGGELPSKMDPDFTDGPPPPFVEIPVTRLDISSSLVRERIAEGRSVRYLLPERVREIIEGEKLYLSE